ncbi:MAG: apolipoprotein N-acyltransferase [Candidatus Acidiferrales bacterium]
MKFSRHSRLWLAAASGLSLALSFPNFNFSLLAWISVGLLVVACAGARPVDAVLCAFAHSLLFYPVCLTWVDTVMRQYGNVNPWISALLLISIGVADGVICLPFTCGVALASRRSAAYACVAAPFLWVTCELLRTHLPYIGFPWNSLGYAASGNLALVQITSVTGILGLSFLIAAFSSLLAYAAVARSRRAGEVALVPAVVLALIALWGGRFVPAAPARYVAHLVQTNFPQSEEYPSDWLQVHAAELNQLAEISVEHTPNVPTSNALSAAVPAPSLIVWPEVPAPFSLQDPPFAKLARSIAHVSQSNFLVGVVDSKVTPDPKNHAAPRWTFSNSAVLLDPAGERVFAYDKIHLVPFGEYVPLRHWLTFAKRLTADISDFTPGSEYRVGQLPGGRFSVFICFEAVFPNEVRRFTANGAQLLINLSNDGWFGRSAAPAQHLMMARVRAVENRLWLLRDTNNGYTVSVDPYGRIVAEMATDIRDQLDAPYDFRSDLTPYVRFGDWLPWLCVIVSVAMLIFAFIRRRS